MWLMRLRKWSYRKSWRVPARSFRNWCLSVIWLLPRRAALWQILLRSLRDVRQF